MKPPEFAYHDPTTVDEVKRLLAEVEEARVLAGGQSLVPMLNMRLSHPSALISLHRVAELDHIRDEGSHLAVGAATTYRQLQRSPLVQQHCPLVAAAIPYIGHAAIWNRGTIGGSLAHADPAAELPAVVAALDAVLVVDGPQGRREVRPADFFLGTYMNTLDEGELLVEVRLPKAGAVGVSVKEMARRRGDFAMCGVAAQVSMADGQLATVRVGLLGVGSGPVVPQLQDLRGEAPSATLLDEAGRIAADASSPWDDLHGSADYRRRLVRVLTRRALEEALSGSPNGGGQSPS